MAGTPPNSQDTFEDFSGNISKQPQLCASLRAVPWADAAEQQLSSLAPSGCKLSADVHIFAPGLPQALGTEPLSYI